VARHPIRDRLRGRGGFTLIEALVAFLVLALAMAAMQRLAVGNVAATVRAAERIEAGRIAETLLSSHALGARGQADAGRIEGHDWSVRFEPVPLAAGAAGGIGARVFRPMRMIVTVQLSDHGRSTLVAESIRAVGGTGEGSR